MDWKEDFNIFLKEFVNGKYLIASGDSNVKHFSVFFGSYSMSISVSNSGAKFEVILFPTIKNSNWRTVMSLTYLNGEFISCVGDYEEYQDKLVSLHSLNCLEAL